MRFKRFLAVVFAAASASAGAHAATVSSTKSVVAAFEVSALTPGVVTEYGYSCSLACAQNGSGGPENFAGGAHVNVWFGTAAGANDLGSLSLTQSFPIDITNMIAIIPGGLGIANNLSTLFLTFVYVDDEFVVESLRIQFGDIALLIAEPFEIDAAVVPLPASAALFLAGLASVGGALRRRKTV